MPDPINPFDPDAPLVALQSLRNNPSIVTATDEELLLIVRRLRTIVQQPVTLAAELRKESTANPTKRALIAERKKLLADI